MPMLDWQQQSTEADGQLAKYTAKADGKSEDAYVYETDVVFIVASVDEARLLEEIVPGAVEVFDRANREDDNWKFNTAVVPDVKSQLIAELGNAKDSKVKGKAAVSGAAALKSVRLRASKKAVAVTVKLVFGGQTSSVASALTALLAEHVTLSLNRSQQLIPFPTQGGNSEAERGDIVVAYNAALDETYVGRLIESDGSRMSLEDFDNTYAVSSDEVVSVLRLVGDVTALRRNFKARCTRRKMQPSWSAVVVAITSEPGSTSGEIEWLPEHVEAAVKLIESGSDEVDVDSFAAAQG